MVLLDYQEFTIADAGLIVKVYLHQRPNVWIRLFATKGQDATQEQIRVRIPNINPHITLFNNTHQFKSHMKAITPANPGGHPTDFGWFVDWNDAHELQVDGRVVWKNRDFEYPDTAPQQVSLFTYCSHR
jgi:hypothetical protein